MKKIGVILVLLAIVFAPAAMASMEASPWTAEKTYSDKTVGKFKFGFKNLALGWTQLFYQPHAHQVDGKNAWAGLGKGLLLFPVDTIGGALHLVTFLIPVDVPLPEGGVNYTK